MKITPVKSNDYQLSDNSNFDGSDTRTNSELDNDSSLNNSGESNQVESNRNSNPIAYAGNDLEVDEENSVRLDGSSSSGSIATYSWNQVGGQQIEFNDDQSATPSFIAPTVDSDRQLTFQLSVTDNEGNSDTDTVNILVKDVAAGEDTQISDSETSSPDEQQKINPSNPNLSSNNQATTENITDSPDASRPSFDCTVNQSDYTSPNQGPDCGVIVTNVSECNPPVAPPAPCTGNETECNPPVAPPAPCTGNETECNPPVAPPAPCTWQRDGM